jgi:hypothetical protein
MVCLVLALTTGCQSVYRLRCTSDPTPAGVLYDEQFLGETPCTIEIPKNSEWIQDDQIRLTFCLPDGERKGYTVDLCGLKPSSPLAEIVAAPFLLCGGVMLWAGADEEADDDSFEEEEDDDDHGLFWLGLAVGAVGVGIYALLGGDFDSGPRRVHAVFDEASGE